MTKIPGIPFRIMDTSHLWMSNRLYAVTNLGLTLAVNYTVRNTSGCFELPYREFF